jgi:dihydroxyacetone kinase-like predicted kinase
VSRLDVADMRAQVAERAERLSAGEPARTAACGVLAVVTGDGLVELYEGLGAVVLPGGSTMNPSTYELLAGIHDVPAETVIVLPNSSNVFMAAERAAELSEKEVRVLPSRSQQAGLAAVVALEPALGLEENVRAMADVLETVRTAAVAEAARDDGEQRFVRGEAVGFVGEELVAWGDAPTTLRAVLREVGDGAELLTVIAGDGAPIGPERVAELAPEGVELEHEHGGQPSYWWLIAAE